MCFMRAPVAAMQPSLLKPTYWGRTVLLMMCVVFPTAYRGPRAAVLLAGFGIMMLTALRHGRLSVHRELLGWALACSAVGALWMLWGGFNGAPGVPRIITVYVIWPLVYTLCIAAYATERSQEWALRGLIFSQLLIALYGISFILYTAGLLPGWAYLKLDLNQSISLSGGFIEISFDSLNSLLFLVPFSISVLQTWKLDSALSRALIVPSAVLGIIVALLSGRRALQLLTVIAPLITLALVLFAGRGLRMRAVSRTLMIGTIGLLFLLVVCAILVTLLKVDVLVLWQAFAEGFSSSQDASANPRGAQFDALLDE